MTVSATSTVNSSTGNGVTTVFPYSFRILASGDLEVSVDGVVKTLGVDYTLTGVGAGAGGNVTFTAAPANGTKVIRRRNMALVRTTDYQDNGDLLADVLNPDHDAPVLMLQQLQEEIDRAIRMPVLEAGVSGTLPDVATRKDHLLAFNAATGLPEMSAFTVSQVASAIAAAYLGGAATTLAAVAFVQAGTGAVSRGAQDKMREMVSADDFGATPNPAVNQATFIQKAIDAVYAAGGGEVLLEAGSYGLSAALKLYPGVVLRGKGRDSTMLKLMVDGVKAIDSHPLARAGYAGMFDLTVWGYADRNTTQGTDTHRLAVVGPFDSFEMRRVRLVYSRYVSVLADATHVIYDDNDVEKSLRDGLQVYNGEDVQVTNNRISEVADDGIAVHISANGVTKRRVIVTGNKLTKCTGIKVLGTQRAVIENNNLHLCYGYGVFLGLDVNFGEGFVTPFAVSVQNNVFTDTLGLLPVNGANGVAVVYLTATRSLGAGGTIAPAYPGTYNAGSGAYVLPDSYINTAGLNNPRGAPQGIVIRGNTIKNTLSGLVNIADAGFGSIWWTSGAFNPAFVTNIGLRGGALLRGIMVEGDLDGANIGGNHIEGVSEAVLFRNFDVLQNVRVAGNTIRRCTTGPAVDVTVARHVGWTVEDNDIDLDPYHEASGANGRKSPLDGTWAATGGSAYMGVIHTFTLGAVIRRNRFRNCLKATHGGGGSVAHIVENVYEFDWAGATIKGLGNIAQEMGNTCLYRNCDPTSVNFGQYSTTADSGFVVSAGAMPASGFYRIGQFVRNTTPAINGSGRYLMGWYRLTNGSAHVAGTDWAQMWVSNATWV